MVQWLRDAPLGSDHTWDAENRLTQIVTHRDPANVFYLGDTLVEFVDEYDANGNVGQVMDATNVNTITTAAKYEYDPYGNTLSATGTYAASNPFRFSTKWFDTERACSRIGCTIGQSRSPIWEGCTTLTITSTIWRRTANGGMSGKPPGETTVVQMTS